MYLQEPDFTAYVEIESSQKVMQPLPGKVYTAHLPETLVGESPVELQEFYYQSSGKGSRTAYSYRPTSMITFANRQPQTPLIGKLHKHDYFELVIVVSEGLHMQIESQLCDFENWDVCILNRTTRHAERFHTDGKLFYLALSPEYLAAWHWEAGMSLQRTLLFRELFSRGLRDTIQQNKDFVTARYKGSEVVSPINSIVQALRMELEQKQPGYQHIVRGLIYRLLSILSDPEMYDTTYTNLGADDGFSLAFSIKKILDKEKRRITSQELSKRLNYNADYLNRVFRHHYGQSIPEYNREVCLTLAATLLSSTSRPIHDICRQLGYTNRTHFYTLFQERFGCTPSSFRKNGDGRKD